MATVFIQQSNRRIESPDEVRAFLAQYGIVYERWPVDERVSPDASADDILRAYDPEIQRLKSERGYVTADVINVTPETPNLEAMLNKFNKEHTHSEDEVRFIVKGRGVFHIHPANAEVFGLEVEGGDLINVPAGTQHWFDLCLERTIRAIRLFRDTSGWTPSYTQTTLHENFQPLCWGPGYLPAERMAGKSVPDILATPSRGPSSARN